MRFWLSCFELDENTGANEQVSYGPCTRDELDERISECVHDMQAPDDDPKLWRIEIVVAP